MIGKRILDFGCGRGELSLFLAKHEVKSICGTAVREETLQFAENSTTKEELLVKPSFHLGKHGKIVFPDNSFDLILCFDVLEHILTNRKKLCSEWRRVLVKGGKGFCLVAAIFSSIWPSSDVIHSNTMGTCIFF